MGFSSSSGWIRSDSLIGSHLDERSSSDYPLFDAIETFIRREDAERFIEEVLMGQTATKSSDHWQSIAPRCEHTFVAAEAHAHVRFRRAIERRALWAAEDAARELPNLPLEDAHQLVHLYAELGSPKFERAARRWLVRYLSEGTPSMRDIAKVAASLADQRSAEGGVVDRGR